MYAVPAHNVLGFPSMISYRTNQYCVSGIRIHTHRDALSGGWSAERESENDNTDDDDDDDDDDDAFAKTPLRQEVGDDAWPKCLLLKQ